MEKIQAFDFTGLMVINSALLAVWFVAPRIDHKVNSQIAEANDGYPTFDFFSYEILKVKSNLQKDIPSIVFMLNFSIAVLFIGAKLVIANA